MNPDSQPQPAEPRRHAFFFWLGCVLAAAFWLLDSVIDVLFFGAADIADSLLATEVELEMRLAACLLIVLCSLLRGKYLHAEALRSKLGTTNRVLHASSARLRANLDGSPVSLWEEDYSAIKARIDALARAGVVDFRAHFARHPEEVKALCALAKVVDINAVSAQVLRCSTKEDVVRDLAAYLTAESLPDFGEELAGLAMGSTHFRREFTLRDRDGEPMVLDIHLSIAKGHEADWSRVLVSFLDVTERSRSDAFTRRLTATYAAISRCNAAIIRIHDESELFEELCRICVDAGDMRMAWIGKLEAESRRIVPVARYGSGIDYLDDIFVSLRSDIPQGHGPMGTAMRENRPVLNDDILTDDSMAPWRASALAHGWRSGGAFPIQRNDAPFAALMVYRSEANAFDAMTVRLLVEMSLDIAFALGNMDRERARIEAERQLAASEAMLRTVIESEPECVKLVDRNGRLLQMNRSGLDMIEADALEQVSGKEIAQVVLPAYRAAFRTLTERVFAGDTGQLRFEIRGLKGGHRWLETHAAPLRDGQGNITALLGVTRDISSLMKSEKTIRNLVDELSATLEAIPDLLITMDLEGRFIDIKATHEALLAAPPGTARGGDIHTMLPPDAAQVVLQGLRAANALGSDYGRVITIANAGQKRWFELSVARKPSAENEAPHFVVLSREITARKRAEEKLDLAARVFREAQEGILISDADGIIIDVNPTFSEVTGYSREEAIGQSTRLLKSERQPAEFYATMWRSLIERGQWKGEVWNRRKNGEIYAELLTISALRDEGGKTSSYVALFSDITASKQQQQALEMMAHYDPLTRLPNRVLFADRFNQALARAKRDKTLLAVCYLDLDGFKPVNDSLGHATGDALLIKVAARIKAAMREDDTVSRQGGDEFALLFGDLQSIDQVENALARIHQIIAQPYAIGEHTLTIAASSGVTLYPQDNADPDTLLRHADQAMYQAKLEGRNRYQMFDPQHANLVADRRVQLQAIEAALVGGEFCLHYQPKVNMRSGETVGAEALIRWNHRTRGLLSPHEFLPAIQGTPLDGRLGDWVVETALHQMSAWKKSGLDLRLSVNISPSHLQDKDFLPRLASLLAAHPELSPGQLELEILESSALDDIVGVSGTIGECRRRLGVRFALDDFGTGYSSLTHMRNLDVATVKIDRSFVSGMIDDPDDYAIVAGVIGLSRAFQREVVAEGVETEDHGLLLLNIGCELAQGYGIARPMPAEALPGWLASYAPPPAWIARAARQLSAKEAQLQLIKLESGHWLRKIEACLEATDTDPAHWPIMPTEKCHCGRWIHYAHQENIFDPAWLGRLEAQHAELHRVGHQLMELCLAGKAGEARAGLPRLRTSYAPIAQTLEQDG